MPTPSHHTPSASLIDRIISFHNTQSQAISLTKLYQLLYLIDFGHYALHGTAVSDFEYFRHKNELHAVGATDYIQLVINKKELQTVEEPNATYATRETLPGTALNVIEKTLTRFNDVSEKEISRIISYHPTWIVTQDRKILALQYASNCDFEWLDYFSHEMTREEYEELERQRKHLENSERMKGLEARLKAVKA